VSTGPRCSITTYTAIEIGVLRSTSSRCRYLSFGRRDQNDKECDAAHGEPYDVFFAPTIGWA
jgi:hypothetical protein